MVRPSPRRWLLLGVLSAALSPLGSVLGSLLPSAHAGPPAGVSGAASLIPGLGQALNGDVLEGLAWFGVIGGSFFSPSSQLRQIGFDLWMYNMYDAYRDAGARPAAPHNVLQNWSASLNPLNLLDPIGAPIVATGAIFGARSGYPALRDPAEALTYTFVGLGEEGLFRGFLFPAFTWVLFDSVWAGAITSSMAFSAMHISNGGAYATAGGLLYTFTGGMLFAWQAHRNHYDLRKSIFAHSWFDILVSGNSAAARPPGYGLAWKLVF